MDRERDDVNEIEFDSDLVRVVEAAPEVRFQPLSFSFLILILT